MENYTLPTFKQLWNEALGVYKERWEKLWILSVPLLALNIFNFTILGNAEGVGAGLLGLISVVLTLIVFMFSQSAFFGNLVNNNESYEVALKDSPKYLWTTMLEVLVVICGFILFIVPGIIWSISLVLFPVIIADQKVSGFKALELSRQYLRGQLFSFFLKLFIFNFVLAIPTILLGILGGNGKAMEFFSMVYDIFVIQAMAVFLYVVYTHLKASGREIPTDVKWLKKVAIGGAGLVLVLGVAGGIVYYKFKPQIDEAIRDRDAMEINLEPGEASELREPQGAEEGL